MEHKDNLLGVLSTLFKWKKQILYVCLIAGVGAVVISLFLDNYYESSTIFYVASPDQALPEPVGVEDTDRKYYGESEDVDRILTIAEGSEVANFLIKEFNLYEVYDIDSTNRLAPHKVMKAFRSHYTVKKTKYDAIEIAMEDKDPKLAAEMVNAARWKTETVAQNIIKGNQTQKMATIGRVLTEKNQFLIMLSDSMRNVRERFNVYNTITQSEGLAKQISSAESRLVRERARKDILSKKSAKIWRDTLAMIDAVISGTEQQIIKLNEILNRFNQGVAQVELLEHVHEEASEQLSLDQERLKQLQAVNSGHINTLFVVEPGEVPIYKSRPRRSIICIAAVFIAFILSVIGILILDLYKDVNWREIINGQ